MQVIDYIAPQPLSHSIMPTYEFRCPKGHEFERFYKTISAGVSELACPECGAIAVRQLSGGGGLVFKGSGFYLTDYGKNAHRGTAPTDKPADKSADKPAEKTTEKTTERAADKKTETKAETAKSGSKSESAAPKAESKTKTKSE